MEKGIEKQKQMREKTQMRCRKNEEEEEIVECLKQITENVFIKWKIKEEKNLKIQSKTGLKKTKDENIKLRK